MADHAVLDTGILRDVAQRRALEAAAREMVERARQDRLAGILQPLLADRGRVRAPIKTGLDTDAVTWSSSRVAATVSASPVESAEKPARRPRSRRSGNVARHALPVGRLGEDLAARGEEGLVAVGGAHQLPHHPGRRIAEIAVDAVAAGKKRPRRRSGCPATSLCAVPLMMPLALSSGAGWRCNRPSAS